MFLNDEDIHELELILSGYHYATTAYDLEPEFPYQSSKDFSAWLSESFGWSLSRGWATAIKDHSGGRSPLVYFFTLYDRFNREQAGDMTRVES